MIQGLIYVQLGLCPARPAAPAAGDRYVHSHQELLASRIPGEGFDWRLAPSLDWKLVRGGRGQPTAWEGTDRTGRRSLRSILKPSTRCHVWRGLVLGESRNATVPRGTPPRWRGLALHSGEASLPARPRPLDGRSGTPLFDPRCLLIHGWARASRLHSERGTPLQPHKRQRPQPISLTDVERGDDPEAAPLSPGSRACLGYATLTMDPSNREVESVWMSMSEPPASTTDPCTTVPLVSRSVGTPAAT